MLLAICLVAAFAAAVVIGLVGVALLLRRRGMDRWIGTYARQSRMRSRMRGPTQPDPAGRPVHLLLCVADHYEPQHGKVDPERAAARVRSWVENYPRQFNRFRDA